ncbi:MAG: hypothetical protein D3M94_20635 [Rhodocyclales bacterium GT-UBC]|nr:MAG: hypothetical protein D3M94_20635 [Rhodocyclales bacterium GT-UBC]
MRPPKILPWIARKAGVDDASAIALWQRAADESAMRLSAHGADVCWRNTMNRFVELIRQKSLHQPV